MKECPACHRCFPDQVNHCPSDGDRLNFLINLDTTLDGRYLLERKLGQGGMGLVFKAHHKFIKTQHAIKVILPDLVGNDPSLAARFRQEAMAAAAIRHPNTVSVTDYGILGETTPYLVMEFVEGRSLHDLLSEQKRLAPAAAVEIMLGVCAGVAAAHRQGIVHRDLKPLNIMLRLGAAAGEGVKVLDFGLAKIKSGELLGSFVAAQTQGIMGSPFYMAPEQWSDEDIDVRADIYSLGVILYQMIAGDVPFRGKSVPSIMSMHLNAPPVPLAERGVEVPPLLERAIQHALEKEPGKRPGSVEELVAELREAMPQLNGSAVARESGATTQQIGPANTTGLEGAAGFGTSAQPEGPVDFKTIASSPDALGTAALEAEPPHQGAVTSADLPVSRAQGSRGSDTARQDPAQTVGQFGAFPSTQHFSEEAPTEPLPPGADPLRTLEEGRRAEEQRRRQEEEEQLRRESAERQRQEREERAAALAAGGQAAAHAAGSQAGGAHATAAAGVSQPHGLSSSGARAAGAAPTRSRAPLVAVGAVLLLALLAAFGVAGYFLLGAPDEADTPGTSDANAAANANAVPTPDAAGAQAGVASTRAELVPLPGGSFRMGRSDVPPITDELKRSRPGYLLWMYSQWPAHEVRVGAFAIDRTEVTNAEYAEFVRETGHAPPPGVWDGSRPFAGSELLPVSNVTFGDAQAFAAWRSRRDGVTYRLPTEEEWEFAARGGDSSRTYPWGAEWSAGYANLGGAGPARVGSHPLGRTPQGLDDMIGNVWEWTSSEASMYKGNDRTALQNTDRGNMVVRGGSYESRPDGGEPVTATARRWYPRESRHPVLGFRLVRAER